MGMFDSLYDKHGNQWQTKAFDCLLANYDIGDSIPGDDLPASYQVEVLGDTESYATVRDGVLVAVPAERDPSLPLVDYYGGAL